MLFNSLVFVFFFFAVYTPYIFFPRKWQNRLLLVASYVFYGSWDWRFLSLLLVSTVLDYFCGLKIFDSKTLKSKRLFLCLSIAGNLSILGFFKYYNFFVSNFTAFLGYFGISIQPPFLSIILPVGISFYTFQTMSYAVDIYRGELRPTKNFLDFALFVSYFPQLVAGPILRAKKILPQIYSERNITKEGVLEGCYLILWGYFQKIFVADSLSRIVDIIFQKGLNSNGALALCGVYAFAFQIYCDFAGYSNIARGLGKCMGFDIMFNFNLPYFATNPREFWRRWHISLSGWLRDYLYIPLGGSKNGVFYTYRNLLITMWLGGLWHGAKWTFVLWGIYQGVLLVIHRLIEPLLKKLQFPHLGKGRAAWQAAKMLFFFHLICFGWFLFRAHSVGQAWQLFSSIFTNFHLTPEAFGFLADLGYYLGFLLCMEIIMYLKDDLLCVLKWPVYAKAGFVVIVLAFMGFNLIFGKYSVIGQGQPFIYFQF